mmetsp:Transcript_16890/g.42094  ORF Transcript_16890/g.42094 Transcript_16890/m.42094 type:complete len:83 (-) Transcript_16890:685-933(-)
MDARKVARLVLSTPSGVILPGLHVHLELHVQRKSNARVRSRRKIQKPTTQNNKDHEPYELDGRQAQRVRRSGSAANHAGNKS